MQEIFMGNWEKLLDWGKIHGARAVIIIVVAFLFYHFSSSFLERIVRKVVRSEKYHSAEAEKKREDTLIKVLGMTVKVLVWLVVAMMILSELGINIGPIIAAAGVAGLAFGFGGQYLIRDVISGLFIILENQYRVGDVACFDGTCGVVEDINLRLTTLRDLDGTVHHIPNGEIKKASNLSKGFSRINIDLGIAYHSDLEKVIQVVDKVGEEMFNDPVWREMMEGQPKFLRVEEFADSAIIIKILGDTKPLKQWDVAGEFRKRIKIAFDKEGIEIPFPQRVIHEAPKINT